VDEEEAFLAAIRAQPADPTSRLVYADWLDERDDPRGEYLRLLCMAAGWVGAAESRERVVARLQELSAEFDPMELRAELDPSWLAAVQKGVGWRTLFEANLLPEGDREYGERYEFGPPATAEQLADAEAVLGVPLPAELRELLSEFNGVWYTVGRVRKGRSEPDILYLDIEHMTVSVPQHLRAYSEGEYNWHPPLEESRQVVFICCCNGFHRLWGVCTGDVAGYRVGEVIQLNPDGGGWEASHPSLADFVRTGYK
jgi:uncharacterized protein (TIGR02996 family)